MASNFFDKASLVMVPDAPFDGTLPSVKPFDRSGDFTFSRGSNLAATRVGPDGNIEKGRENLLLQSNQFDTTWLSNVTLTSGQSGYDGSNDAWILERTATGFQRLYQSVTSGGVQTLSVYAKNNNARWLFLNGVASSASPEQWFDLENGVLGTSSNLIDSTITDVGNGWFRCSMTFNNNITEVRITNTNADNTTGGTIGHSIYIQNAQLEYGLVATDYLDTKTTTKKAGVLEDEPRIDFTDSDNPSLLLEPSRTNLVPHSEYFEAWDKTGTVTITSNYGISPEGVKNSARIQFSGASNELRDVTSVSAGNVSTIYIKGTSGETIKFGATGAEELFTLTGEWQRLEKYNSGAATKITLNTYSGATARDVEVWGAMQEEGSYATSYIPTYGSTVTRSMENCTESPLATLSNNYSIFAEVTRIADDAINNQEFIDYRSSNNDRLRIYAYNNGRIRFRTYFNDGTNDSYFTNSSDWNQGNTIKFCFTYDNGDIVIYANGKQLYSVSKTLNNLNYLNMETQKIQQLLHFETTLTSSEAIALTTI